MTAPRVVARLVGDAEEPLVRILGEILSEVGVSLAGDNGVAPADVILAVLGRADADSVLALARSRSVGAPIVAILPFTDDRRAESALLGGASACYALDTSTNRLRAILHTLLAEHLELAKSMN